MSSSLYHNIADIACVQFTLSSAPAYILHVQAQSHLTFHPFMHFIWLFLQNSNLLRFFAFLFSLFKVLIAATAGSRFLLLFFLYLLYLGFHFLPTSFIANLRQCVRRRVGIGSTVLI